MNTCFQSCRARRGTQQRLLLTALMACVIPSAAARGQATPATPALALSDVLSAVFAAHPLLAAARAHLQATQAARTTAGLPGNPVLSYQIDYTSTGAGPVSVLEREAMTVATIPLEPLYQRNARVRGADARVRVAESEFAATRQRVALEAVGAYYRVALAQERVAAVQDVAAWLDTLVSYNRLRVGEGVAAEADLLRTELERDRVVADGSIDQADLVRARAALVPFVGASRGAGTPLVASMHRPLTLKPNSELLATATPRQRPELDAARERVAAAQAGVAAERANIVRQIGAVVGNKQMGGTNSLVAGLSLPLPLFDQNRGEIARATAEHEANALELSALERQARAELAGAQEAAQLLTDRATQLTRSDSNGFLARADEARRIALGAYREGGTSLLQVLDAARLWSDSRIAFFRVLYAQHESVLALMVAQGTDLSLAIPALTAPSPR